MPDTDPLLSSKNATYALYDNNNHLVCNAKIISIHSLYSKICFLFGVFICFYLFDMLACLVPPPVEKTKPNLVLTPVGPTITCSSVRTPYIRINTYPTQLTLFQGGTRQLNP